MESDPSQSSGPALILLIRHATTPMVDKGLSGRLPGIHLSDQGRAQAAGIARSLERFPISKIFSSPLERALESAGPLAGQKNLPVQIREGLGEIDLGRWQGETFDELAGDDNWVRFNRYRSGTGAPGGELMLETQARVMQTLYHLAAAHPGQAIAAFSHADPIKSAVMHVLGIPLDFHDRLEILPASLTALELSLDNSQVRYVNVSLADPWHI